MNWSALTKKQQYMVFATGILVVAQVGFLIFVLTKPDSDEAGDASSKEALTEIQAKLDDAELVMKKAKMTEKALEESVDKIETLKEHTPTLSDRYAWAYEYVSVRAAKAGVELDSLEEVSYVGDEETALEEQRYEIRFETRCDYNRLVELLWRIEEGNPLVRVKNVEISMQADSPDRQRVQVVLQWPSSLQVERGNL